MTSIRIMLLCDDRLEFSTAIVPSLPCCLPPTPFTFLTLAPFIPKRLFLLGGPFPHWTPACLNRIYLYEDLNSVSTPHRSPGGVCGIERDEKIYVKCIYIYVVENMKSWKRTLTYCLCLLIEFNLFPPSLFFPHTLFQLPSLLFSPSCVCMCKTIRKYNALQSSKNNLTDRLCREFSLDIWRFIGIIILILYICVLWYCLGLDLVGIAPEEPIW